MGLVTAKEVAQAIKVDKFGFIGTFIGWLLMKVTKISSINTFYDNHKHLTETAFLDAILEHYQIKFEIPEEDFRRLPKDGAYITISNHPLGGIDGVLLLKLLLQHREDFKIMANFLLNRIEPMSPYILPVNPFESRKEVKSSLAGFKNAMLHIRGGHPLGIFPAGEVSTYRDGKLIVDKPWEETALKLIRKAEVPVVPIYFHAKNSRLFYRLSKISDVFRTAKLPSEVTTQKNRVIKVRIGQPISVKTQNEQKSLVDFTDLLRRKTYMLSNAFEKERLIDKVPTTLKIPKAPKKIATPISRELIEQEIEELRKKDCRLLQSKSYEVFLATADDMPFILQEIGRQREVTFRAIGEGTNKAIDLDEFDNYYHHLFLWDDNGKAIVGAYRMGLGGEIFKKYGIDGFYVQDLFRLEPELYGMMKQTIEMGRAYIVKEYQQKPMPLFLLWKGIVHTTLRHPEYKYLIGGVSISNQFSNFSKSLMIEFMKSNYWDPYVAQYIRPKKEFKVKLKDADKEFIFDETEADLNKFDRLIDEVEPGNLRLPVLIKKYIKQNAKVVAFNVDPLFNNSVDGLMYIKIADIPESTVKPVMEEFQAELEQKLHNNEQAE
ncbi:lysophospholipid acyltransferase family protein [Cellulophaga lytica]|uniref:Phospholipid/glycerol acyltransferase n=1 Tax=Cellulophaga lytica (strain ATCC 23178 / DSM 7489 / JCM 8516 / NBRC 14961 / NCIMB 1423 / VKM B-1433 / Cy l20) TaxID=867900 RepID=F0RBF4_CELLC|nr:lysophospholipid acyltransferase family protein [Cellulophaga lytica]ADY29576.1 phospholipid/glycerol acyltransferase [Cellulophaga lytica DSM 7489]AIM60579.1 glycerol acyltransferase [Cellulophaga lytica]MDO6852364.1 lysophospholipid acyltransferase family protein [Cellulophaga lytica]WQG76253.1 lysophospholipid acyltransferase family protein [Cellulophaga lytica]SNQ42735.1 Phospholipid/glycerol Acyltransferase / hemolysin fusion [Cellulophaga lytica]